MILPTKISCSFFMEEIIEVTNSGSDVPNAIIVRAITLSDIPKLFAIFVAII